MALRGSVDGKYDGVGGRGCERVCGVLIVGVMKLVEVCCERVCV